MLVRDGKTIGEGFHHVRGAPHAEREAVEDARERGHDTRGATLVVSLEPCDRHGKTPPCTDAVLRAGISRVIVGTLDPSPEVAGVERLRAAGVEVDVVDDAWSRAIIEPFAIAINSARPYVTLKLAASLDGYVAPQPGSHWLTGSAARERVRELRIVHDAVMVGAGTVRVDDPQLTVRPAHARMRPYVRIVACEDAPVPASSRVFSAVEGAGYARTIVLAPAAVRSAFAELEPVAQCIFVEGRERLDLGAALVALKAAGIFSVLCEGGPTLAAALLAGGFVDRLVWLVAPVLLAGDRAVRALARGLGAGVKDWAFDSVERVGDDLWLTAKPSSNV